MLFTCCTLAGMYMVRNCRKRTKRKRSGLGHWWVIHTHYTLHIFDSISILSEIIPLELIWHCSNPLLIRYYVIGTAYVWISMHFYTVNVLCISNSTWVRIISLFNIVLIFWDASFSQYFPPFDRMSFYSLLLSSPNNI